jgi:hypothetical protein
MVHHERSSAVLLEEPGRGPASALQMKNFGEAGGRLQKSVTQRIDFDSQSSRYQADFQAFEGARNGLGTAFSGPNKGPNR